ncbi:MAG: hypothetical protein JXQ76_00910 [Campylobacterales bacterium]|nr:hypothetical protein [Campylobacterales bacterium]
MVVIYLFVLLYELFIITDRDNHYIFIAKMPYQKYLENESKISSYYGVSENQATLALRENKGYVAEP